MVRCSGSRPDSNPNVTQSQDITLKRVCGECCKVSAQSSVQLRTTGQLVYLFRLLFNVTIKQERNHDDLILLEVGKLQESSYSLRPYIVSLVTMAAYEPELHWFLGESFC